MSQPYIMPVILASDIKEAMSHKKVVVSKERVFKDIDLLTHKHVDAHEEMGLRTGNAVSSDVDEKVDATIIARFVEFRDTIIRAKLQFALEPISIAGTTDAIDLSKQYYIYNLKVDEDFNDNVLLPLTEYIHRYLVFGALADWYGQFGMAQAGIYGPQADALEQKISDAIRGASIAKRPLQPFGPQNPL